jgi:hypothetical protein
MVSIVVIAGIGDRYRCMVIGDKGSIASVTVPVPLDPRLCVCSRYLQRNERALWRLEISVCFLSAASSLNFRWHNRQATEPVVAKVEISP